jgi:putative two-component system response regulator
MRTILVVDDAAENLQLLSELLKPLARVRVARAGAKALEIARESPPDLILLDVLMPELDGFAVLERLKAMPQCAGVPVIFVTSLDGSDDEERGLKLGAVDYISKPLKPAVVLARVRTQLELKQARDAMNHRNAVLETEVAARMRESNMIRSATIRAFANIAETRDNDTGEHVRRTQEYVRLLAEDLRSHPRFRADLSGSNLDIIVESAPLHDIGKVGVPDAVLLKPGKLTAEEFEVMKTHTTMGGLALEQAAENSDPPIAFLHIAATIARSHHEKWDGTGYPDKLAGDAIPAAARLMAVSDVFDALTTERVYKRAMSADEAREIIVNGRGAHFDPAVVDAFVARFDDFTAVMRTLANEDDEQPVRDPVLDRSGIRSAIVPARAKGAAHG